MDDDPNLSPTAKQLIEDPANQRWLSIASPWEMAIKHSVGKLTLNAPLKTYLAKNLPLHMIQIMPISIDHLAVVDTLPLHHRDPFDRLIVSQALVENLALVSADRTFDLYPVHRKW